MTNQNLGMLEAVDLREVWKSESDDFTPWLATQENIGFLGEALGMQLEFQEREKKVGPYYADILCKDLADDRYVVIENQLEATDHDHLGKLLTYAAEFKVSTVIWIARRFTDEHRAAVDWLNEISAEAIGFFGLEIEIWKIGESAPAPKFNIVAKPNSWTKGGRAHVTGLTDTQQLQLDFWRGFEAHVSQYGQRIKRTSTPRAQNWMAAGRVELPGFLLFTVVSTYSEARGWDGDEIRVELHIRKGDLSAQYYDRLLSQREELEQEMDGELSWPYPHESTRCKVYIRRDTDLNDPDARTEQYLWLLDRLETFHRVFADRVRKLEVNSPGPAMK